MIRLAVVALALVSCGGGSPVPDVVTPDAGVRERQLTDDGTHDVVTDDGDGTAADESTPDVVTDDGDGPAADADPLPCSSTCTQVGYLCRPSTGQCCYVRPTEALCSASCPVACASDLGAWWCCQ